MTRLLSSPLWRRHGPLALALAPTLWVARTLVVEAPLSYDHATHLFKAWHFWTEMLGRGRVRGWSHYWGFGFPADELVPCGGEVWVALFRALTFGQLSWLGTYALAFGAFLLFKAFAVFWLSRRFFGAAAGVLAAWLATLDPGGMLEGGWQWHTFWGVWPVTLAMSFASLGLVKLEDVLCSGGRRDVAWAGLWVGAALLTHQLALLLLVAAVPLLIVDHLVRAAALSGRNVLGAAGALAFGFALSAFTLVPFFARSGDTMDLGHLGDPLAAVSQRFLELRTFQNVWAPVNGLAIVGAWLALRARVPGGAWFAGCAGAFVVLSSDTLIRDLHLERAFGSLIKIEANRMLLVAKLFWFPLCAHAVVHLARVGANAFHGARLARVLSLAVGMVLAGVLIVPGFGSLYASQVAKEIQGEEEARYYRDFQSLTEWSRQERESTAEHYRIAYHSWRGNHLPTLAAVFDRTAIYNVYFTATQIFDKLPMTDEHELLTALSVKYVVSPLDLKRRDLALDRRFGALRVYRFSGYRAEPFTVLGAGKAELLELAPERIRVRVSGTDAGSRLKLHVASYDRWQATLAGAVLPIASVPVYGPEYPVLMEVPARDGELVFEYVYRGADWLGLALTLAAAPLFALTATALRRRRSLREWSLPRAWGRPLAWSLAAAAVLVVVLVVLRTQSRRSLLQPTSLFHRLQGADLALGGVPCEKRADLSFRCGSHRVRADMITGIWGMHLCMNAPDVGPLELRLKTELGSFLLGEYEPAEKGRGTITVSVGGRDLGEAVTRPASLGLQNVAFDTRAWRQQEPELVVVLAGAALHCFDLRVVP